ncbi:MAG: MDR family oxidoreductase [Bacteroidota bacterium]
MTALLLTQADDGLRAALTEVDEAELPEGDVLIDVAYSSLNYKDGLAVTGKGKIVRGTFPFVPGIDLAGTVAASESDRFAPGDAVILTGWGTGEDRWGGFAERARASAEHLVALPDGLSLHESMAIGTAGFTAVLAVTALEEHGVTPASGEVVVTGASGGAGSLAVALLARLGYDAVASTGTPSAHGYLRTLGASRIIRRDELGDGPARPMEKARWAGAVDGVGGKTLATLLAQTDRHGSVAAYGLAQSHELSTTVFPFILRGVNLLGVDSNTCPPERRRAAWDRLADLLTSDDLDAMQQTIGLGEVVDFSEKITRGETQGRIVVDVNA